MKPPNLGLHFEEAYTLSVRFPLVFGSIIRWDVQDGCFMIWVCLKMGYTPNEIAI